MNYKYESYLPKVAMQSPRLTAKREYLYAKRYDAPADVIRKLYQKWQRFEDE
jgi:hypothetical protein|tara:strand:- start:110 stop:265 length:156 start_codon:yes stop_codon:yes gene_type:complete